ncbi:MAG: UDP-N-acetylglucosamine 2-epimerase [Candidatus Hodarchaeales archaeon]|jgi:hypothetical protein
MIKMGKTKLKELILIGSELKNRKIIQIITALQKNDHSHLIISLTSAADSSLTSHSISHELGDSYLQETHEFIENDIRNWLSNWVFRDENDHKSIFESFKQNIDSFWWFIDRRIRFEILEVFFKIKILQDIEKKTEFKRMIWYDESRELDFLIPQIFDLSTLNYKRIGSKFSVKIISSLKSILKRHFGVFFLQKKESSYSIWSRILFKKYSWSNKISGSSIAIVSNSKSWRLCYNKRTNRFEHGDYYFHDIKNELKNKYPGEIIEAFKLQNIREDLRVLKEKKELNEDNILVILDTLMDSKSKKKYKKEIKFFKLQLKSLERRFEVKNYFTYSSINFDKIMKERIIWYFKAYIPLGIRWKAQFTSLIAKMNPKAILFINEFFTFGKAITLSSREHENVYSYAIQHGFFTELDIGADRPSKSQEGTLAYHLPVTPDKTCVYGPYYESLLLKVGFEKEKIYISGNPTYDSIKILVSEISSEEIINELDLSKKIVVFGTQPDFFENAVGPIRSIINFGAEYPNFQLIIKVHPREDVEQYSMFHEDAEIPVHVIKDVNIFALLKICDFYLSQHSTTILDAIATNKPVGIVNFSNRPSSLRFLKSEAICELTNPKMIEEIIPKILEDTDFRNKQITLQQKFLTDQAYKIDGRAAERIVNLVLNTILS